MSQCKNCHSELSGDYCSHCGRPVSPKRIDMQYVRTEIGQLLYVEKGFFYTIKELFIRPGKNIKAFIAEDRNRLVKPLVFLFITSLIYTLINYYFHFEDSYVDYTPIEGSYISTLLRWTQGNQGYANIIMGIFVAFWTKVFFKKYGYNFFEILILLCFVMGIEVLINSLFAVVEVMSKMRLMHVAAVVGALYTVWATVQFFERKFVNYLKAIAASAFGYAMYIVSIILTGTVIDLIVRYC